MNHLQRSVALFGLLLGLAAPNGFGAVHTVTSLDESGPGSLRAWLSSASDGDTINFGVTGTITLTSGELMVLRSLNIMGPGPDDLAISGGNASRIFSLDNANPATPVTIAGLSIRDGLIRGADGGDGGFGQAGRAGESASGGAILNKVTLTISNCLFMNNTAVGGAGGEAGVVMFPPLAPLQDFGYQHKDVNGQLALGHRPLLIIVASFAGANPLGHAVSWYDDYFFNLFRTNAVGSPQSVNGAFLEMSSGRFFWSRGGVVGPLSLPAAQRFANLNPDIKDTHLRDQLYASNLVYQALAAGLVDLAPYDVNGDGHIGNDMLQIGVLSNDADGGGAVRSAGTVRGPNATRDWTGSVAELGHLGDFATHVHELSHTLRTEDLYGVWSQECLSYKVSLMSCTIGDLESPEIYHLDPWHKLQLGWSEPRIYSLTAGGSATIPAAQMVDPHGPIILYDPTRGTSEFFMLEYRTRSSPNGPGYDANVADNGLALWRVQQDGNHDPVKVNRVDGGTLPAQTLWRRCNKCQGLHFIGNADTPTFGPCPEGGTHIQDGSLGYQVVNNIGSASGQHGWRWCKKCQGMFFGPGQSSSRCSAGGTHDGSLSGDYSFEQNDITAPGQRGWNFCKKCQGLFYGPKQATSACPASGAHDGSASSSYSVLEEGQNWVVWSEGLPMTKPAFGRGSSRLWHSGDSTPNLRWLDGTEMLNRITVQPFQPGDGSITVGFPGRSFGGGGGDAGGGAICNLGTLRVTHSAFTGNFATGGPGGTGGGAGALNVEAGMGGVGGAGSGAAILHQAGSLTLINCTLSGNFANGGIGGPGGLANMSRGGAGGDGGKGLGGGVSSTNNFSMVNCTLSENAVSGGEGGQGGSGGLPGRKGNSGTAGGGGLFVPATGSANVSIGNTIIAGNRSAATGPDISAWWLVSLGHNLIGDAGSAFGWVGSDLIGTTFAPLNPFLGPLQYNGSVTPVYPLKALSPAIDGGDDAVLGAPVSLQTDQRGHPRRSGTHVDIGAYERWALPVLVANTLDAGQGSLREAISKADYAGVVRFASNVTGVITLTGGEITFGKDLSISGPGAKSLAISGNNSNRVFNIGDGEVLISGLTISNGRIAPGRNIDGSGWCAQGGGIYNAGRLTLSNCAVMANSAVAAGGLDGVYGSPAGDVGGSGGCAQGGGIFNAAQLFLLQCTVAGNTATGGRGGQGGRSDHLGGPGGTGGDAEGGGIYNAQRSLMINSTLSGNSVQAGAGGRGGSATGTGSIGGLGGDSGLGLGGGVASLDISTAIHCTVSSNDATGASGGVGGTGARAGQHGLNSVGTGGGLQSSTTNDHLADMLVAGNAAAVGPDCAGTFQSDGFNLIGIGDGGSLVGSRGDQVGSLATPLDAKLGPLQDNGGETPTQMLLAGSPAIDTGSSQNLPTDQRGARRPFDNPAVANAPSGDGSDIGAVEVGGWLRIVAIAILSNGVDISFTTEAGRSYRIERTDSLGSGAWTTVADNVPGTGGIVHIVDSSRFTAQRCYRGRVIN